jgi:hypothetical protein
VMSHLPSGDGEGDQANCTGDRGVRENEEIRSRGAAKGV